MFLGRKGKTRDNFCRLVKALLNQDLVAQLLSRLWFLSPWVPSVINRAHSFTPWSAFYWNLKVTVNHLQRTPRVCISPLSMLVNKRHFVHPGAITFVMLGVGFIVRGPWHPFSMTESFRKLLVADNWKPSMTRVRLTRSCNDACSWKVRGRLDARLSWPNPGALDRVCVLWALLSALWWDDHSALGPTSVPHSIQKRKKNVFQNLCWRRKNFTESFLSPSILKNKLLFFSLYFFFCLFVCLETNLDLQKICKKKKYKTLFFFELVVV